MCSFSFHCPISLGLHCIGCWNACIPHVFLRLQTPTNQNALLFSRINGTPTHQKTWCISVAVSCGRVFKNNHRLFPCISRRYSSPFKCKPHHPQQCDPNLKGWGRSGMTWAQKKLVELLRAIRLETSSGRKKNTAGEISVLTVNIAAKADIVILCFIGLFILSFFGCISV